LVEPITLLGTLLADRQAGLSVVQPARIVAVDVHEGDAVQRGQILIRLDGAQEEAQQRTAAAGVMAAKAQLGKAEAGREAQRIKADADVQTAQAGLKQAQESQRKAILARDAARDDQAAELALAQENARKAQAGLKEAQRRGKSLEELSTVGGVARNDLEAARTQVATAQADLAQAQDQVRRLLAGPGNGPGKGLTYRIAVAEQDVAAAQTSLEQARQGVATAQRARPATLAIAGREVTAADAAVEQAQAGLTGAQSAAQQLTRLASPLDGVVTGLNAHAGETAQPGNPLVTLVSLTGFRIEALATARQLPRLHTGQMAQVTLDTRPDLRLAARLVAISRIAEADGRSYRIRLRLLRSPAGLRPGQTLRVQLSGG
jgi:HlyD family secretion protein